MRIGVGGCSRLLLAIAGVVSLHGSAAQLVVVNAASYANVAAPGAIVAIFGANLAATTAATAAAPLPTTLGGVTVLVNGRAAPLLYVSPNQVNAQLPYETPQGTATVSIGDASAAISVASAAPGIFRLSENLASLDTAIPGGFITIYATGQGAVSPAVPSGTAAPFSPLSHAALPATATIGNQDALVQYAGLAPGMVGVAQFNLRVPELAPGDYPVVVRVGGMQSNSATVRVGRPWASKLRAEKTGAYPFAGKTYSSSSRLIVSWDEPPKGLDHFEVTASENRSSVTVSAGADSSSVTVPGLKSATQYTVRLRACLDSACRLTIQTEGESSTATEEEYWRVLGSGNSFSSADKLIPDGNVGCYAFRYGDWAGPGLSGKVQLYYTPMQREEKGVKIGEMVAARADSLESVSRFSPVSGFGLLRVCESARPGQPGCPPGESLAASVALYQAVPLAPEMGGMVRLFFEAQGTDGRTRVMYLDSQDGYVGRDFHKGASTICASWQDFGKGGGCEPTVAIGVEADGANGNPKVLNARQFKVAYPNKDASPWNGVPGTPMLFTVDVDRACSDFSMNFGYAVWDGKRWVVQYADNGCPKLMRGVQAAMPVHLGGVKYKLYYSHHLATGNNPDKKPMRLVYADGEYSGNAALVEFEDWEARDQARNVNFLWADGVLLDELNRSRLDDFVIYMPTGGASLQVMYSNMSAADAMVAPPFIGVAALVNP